MKKFVMLVLIVACAIGIGVFYSSDDHISHDIEQIETLMSDALSPYN